MLRSFLLAIATLAALASAAPAHAAEAPAGARLQFTQLTVSPRFAALFGARPSVAAVALPADLALLNFGDSRQQSGTVYGGAGGQSISVVSGNGTTGGFPAFLNTAVNNVMLNSISGGDYGIAASTSLNGYDRMLDKGSCAANIATTGNPAFGTTGTGNDRPYNVSATGCDWVGNHFGANGDPANIVFYAYNYNDPGNSGYYATPSITEAVETNNIDRLLAAGKIVFLLDTPSLGPKTILLEPQTRTGSGPYTVTATNTASHVARDNFPAALLGSYTSGGVIDQAHNILTKVATCGTTDHTYAVSGAVYTLCPNGGSAPTATKVWLSYSYFDASGAEQDYLYAVHLWEHSTLVSGRPNLHLVNCYDQIWNTADTTNHLSLPGMFDPFGKHPTWAQAMRCADAFATAVNAALPGYTSKELPPTHNNYNPCATNTTSTTYSTTNCRNTTPGSSSNSTTATSFLLPASMRGSNCPTTVGGMQFVVAGVAQATSLAQSANGGTGGWASAGSSTVTAGAYDCTAGTWSVTFAAPFAANFQDIEIRQDLTTGQNNQLFDAGPSFGTNSLASRSWVTVAPGATGLPYPWILQDDACLSASVGAGLGSVTYSDNIASSPSTVTDADGTWPAMVWTVNLMATGAGCNVGDTSQLSLLAAISNTRPDLIFPSIPGGSGERGSIRWKVEPGPNGHVEGFQGVNFRPTQTVTGTWTCAWCSAAGSSFSVDGFSPGLTMDDLSLYNGGSYIMNEVTPFMTNAGMDTAGATWSQTGGTPHIYVNMAAGGPLSFKVTMWRERIRPATNLFLFPVVPVVAMRRRRKAANDNGAVMPRRRAA